MRTRTALALLLLATMVGTRCASRGTAATQNPAASSGRGTGEVRAGTVRPAWIEAEVEGRVVSIPAAEVDGGKMLHFRVATQDASMAFMAYEVWGETYVRASVCPPCRSQGFSLIGDALDCDACHSRFEASTGKGISGACKDYPKAGVTYFVSSDKITMKIEDLVTAYENTQRPGWP